MRPILVRAQGGKLIVIGVITSVLGVVIPSGVMALLVARHAADISALLVLFLAVLASSSLGGLLTMAYPLEGRLEHDTLLLRFIYGTKKIVRQDIKGLRKYLWNPMWIGESSTVLVVFKSRQLAMGWCAMLLQGTLVRNDPSASITGADYHTDLDEFVGKGT